MDDNERVKKVKESSPQHRNKQSADLFPFSECTDNISHQLQLACILHYQQTKFQLIEALEFRIYTKSDITS